MRTVTIDDGRLVVAERPDPEPGRGELLVQVAAAGINAPDLAQARGGYPPPPGIPADLPGLELAGEVAATGPGVQRFEPGDRVISPLRLRGISAILGRLKRQVGVQVEARSAG